MDNKNAYKLPYGRRTWLVVMFALYAFMLIPEQAQAQEKAKVKAPKLFGSVEFRGSLKSLPQWAETKQRNLANDILVAGSALSSKTTWEDIEKATAGKTQLEQITYVNSFWNQWPYKQDPAAYKKADYWAAPYEFRRNSGDCEDYAIVKYFTLRKLGFPMEIMRIVVVEDTILNLAHAILAVYLDGDIYILDNLSRNVLSHTRVHNYIPRYSVNEEKRWMHVMPKKK